MVDLLNNYFIPFVIKFPKLAAFLASVGGASIMGKLAMEYIQKFVGETATKVDDEMLAKIQATKVYKYVYFALDLLTRVKLPVIGINPPEQK